MKRLTAIILVLIMLLSVLSCMFSSAYAAMPSADVLNGYENICLTYTYNKEWGNLGRHTVNDFMPYVSYLDTEGNIKDYFFDSFLFLPVNGAGASGANLHYISGTPTTAVDWTSYVNDVFYPNANVAALNTAFGNAKTALGDDTDKKAGVFFSILYPAQESGSDFGSLGGRTLDFTKADDRKYAIKWIIDEQIAKFTEGGYDDLELVGFYWLEEYVYGYNSYGDWFGGGITRTTDYALFKYASDYLHSLGLKFIWIPYHNAAGYNKWQTLGFDFASYQPNYYWSAPETNRVTSTANYADRYGMGVEMEVDNQAAIAQFYNRYLEYLESGITSGAMNSVKTYYQDAKPAAFYNACYSKNPVFRSVYDLTYKYAKGTLTAADIDYNFAKDFAPPADVEWISYGKSYTGCPSYVDGSGTEYQNVSGKELTDGVLGVSELGTEWHAFHTSNLDSEGRMSVTIDLGTVRNDITDFMAHFQNICRYGVGRPTDIRIYVSENGVDFTLVAQPQLILYDYMSYFHYTSTEYLTARYVKLSMRYNASFVFCSEFLVGVGEPAPQPEPEPEPEPEISSPETSEDISDTVSGDTSSDDTSSEDTSSEDTSSEDTSSEDTSSEDTSSEDTSSEDTSSEDTSSEDTSSEDTSSEDTSSEDTSVDDTSSGDASPDETLVGDVNFNNKIDMVDYILLKRAYFRTYKFNDAQNEVGDINKNGEIDMTDYILIKRIYFGTYNIK